MLKSIAATLAASHEVDSKVHSHPIFDAIEADDEAEMGQSEAEG
jgi:hypothetical protein